MSTKKQEKLGLLLGFVAVTCFALTLPMTRLAVSQLDPILVGMGRALVAAIVAAVILWWQRAPWPTKKQFFSLAVVGVSISIAFPVLVAYAMQFLPSSHGAIVIGLLPMGTAYCISLMNHEQPSQGFWWASVLGAATVISYAFFKSGGGLQLADVLLLITVVLGSMGYAHGAVLAKKMGGLRVMCWALVYASPVLAIGTIPKLIHFDPSKISLSIWVAFIYLSLVSQLFGMALWYKALSLGSVSRVSQIQLLQPFLTLIFAALFLAEHIDMFTWLAAILVVLFIQIARKAQVELKH